MYWAALKVVSEGEDEGGDDGGVLPVGHAEPATQLILTRDVGVGAHVHEVTLELLQRRPHHYGAYVEAGNRGSL